MGLDPKEQKLVSDWMAAAPNEIANIGVTRPALATIISLMALGLIERRKRGESDGHEFGLGLLHTLINTIGLRDPDLAEALRRGLPALPKPAVINLTQPPQPRSYHGRQNLN